jgi:esterase/lipase
MLEAAATAIGIGLLVLAVANLAILALAWLERAAAAAKDPWQRATQVLDARKRAGLPSVVLLHGFGGTPRDFQALAGLLHARGYRVVVPAVPEQTSVSFAYGRGRFAPDDYRAWLSRILEHETAVGDAPPLLVGMSMGGALAVIGAADHAIGRLVLISPYFKLAIADTAITRGVRWLRWVLPVLPKVQKAQIADPEGYKAYATGSWLVSLRAFLQLVGVAEIASGKARAISVPTLVLASQNDSVASFAATERLLEGREQVRLVPCNRGNHILTYDYDRERILAEVVGFLTGEPAPQAGQ